MKQLIALFLLATFFSGCASIDERKKSVTLDATTRHYENAIRWGDYATANAYRIHTGARTPDPERLKHFRVTSYETVNSELNADETRATLTVQIKYYDDERMTEETLTDRQDWEYDSKLGQWFLDSPLPAFH